MPAKVGPPSSSAHMHEGEYGLWSGRGHLGQSSQPAWFSLPYSSFHVLSAHGVALPPLQKCPGGQTPQLLADVRPVALEYRPAAQGVPLALPIGQKEPLGHRSGCTVPPGHR